jgi:DNA-binding NarL/FixJ family response regulator
MARALIISNDEGTRYLYETAISYQKIEVDTATDIAGGIIKVEKKKPDIIILDIAVSDIKDVGSLKKLRSDAGSMPVVIMTDMKYEGELKEAEILGAVKTMVKDKSSLSDLIKTVRKIVKK